VWKRTQEHFRRALMSGQLLLVMGTLETRDNVTHIIAGALFDYTGELESLRLKSRNFH
jgi:error-prone DNA polymerase